MFYIQKQIYKPVKNPADKMLNNLVYMQNLKTGDR